MALLPRSTGYLFLAVFTLSVLVGGADAAMVLCCAVQAGLLVLAQRRPGSRAWVLPIQFALTCLPLFVTGSIGVNQGFLLTATVLWCLPKRLRWRAFGLVAVSAGIAHQDWRESWTTYLYGVLTTAAVGIVLYSLLRLPELVDRLATTRGELERITLARERLQVARRLRAALGDQLDIVIDWLGEARRDLEADPAAARQAATRVARVTRGMTQTVRDTAEEHHRFYTPPLDIDPAAGFVPRLTLAALVLSLTAWTVDQTLEATHYRLAIAVGGAAMSSLLLAQLRWPRHAIALLCLHAAITLLPLPWLGASWCVWLILLATAVLLSVPGIRALVIAAGLIALRAAYTEPAAEFTSRVGWVFLAMEATLVLFGLSRFLQLSDQLNRSRAELMRITVHVERLRVARDMHDLLALTLSVLALKSDLITELVTRNPARAAIEIEESLRIAADARTEARAMVEDLPEMSLARELRSARRALADNDVTVHIDSDAGLPERTGALLVPVVREAVTNILRHSAATRAEIACHRRDERLHLSIRNDGVAAEVSADGQGLRNMRARVVDAGGCFTSWVRDGEFVLTAEVPISEYADCTAEKPAVAPATGAAPHYSPDPADVTLSVSERPPE
ncbi:sensor histidine kinase [Nocardia sp. NPDC056000]|uniref:sensor histidine kinase n=1 Tax=Nocardia sp. NPDC056000 TaxID=3345674 RepID=UPI0035D7E3F5